MIYDFKCADCGRMETDVFLSINHAPGERPTCCGKTMPQHFTKAPTVHWRDYDLPDGGFRSYSTPDKPVITSLKQNRDYMERNNLIDANEVFKPPTQEEQFETHKEVMESIEKISLPDDVARELDIV